MKRSSVTSEVQLQSSGDLSDRQLLDASGRGDRRAFTALVRRHGPALLGLARALTRDPGLAEDVVQQALLAAYRAADTFRGTDSARSWLLTITRNKALRVLRKHARETPSPEPLLELGLDAGWGSDDPETMAVRAQQRQLLQRALRALKPADREVLLLRDVEQLSGTETAMVLGVELRAMKSRLHRARLRLAVTLRQMEDE